MDNWYAWLPWLQYACCCQEVHFLGNISAYAWNCTAKALLLSHKPKYEGRAEAKGVRIHCGIAKPNYFKGCGMRYGTDNWDTHTHTHTHTHTYPIPSPPLGTRTMPAMSSARGGSSRSTSHSTSWFSAEMCVPKPLPQSHPLSTTGGSAACATDALCACTADGAGSAAGNEEDDGAPCRADCRSSRMLLLAPGPPCWARPAARLGGAFRKPLRRGLLSLLQPGDAAGTADSAAVAKDEGEDAEVTATAWLFKKPRRSDGLPLLGALLVVVVVVVLLLLLLLLMLLRRVGWVAGGVGSEEPARGG
eukprot:668992-Pelagomonas_calceolata.AAC.1